MDLGFLISRLHFEFALIFLKEGDAFNNKILIYSSNLLFVTSKCLNSKAIETYNRIINIDAYASEAWFN